MLIFYNIKGFIVYINIKIFSCRIQGIPLIYSLVFHLLNCFTYQRTYIINII